MVGGWHYRDKRLGNLGRALGRGAKDDRWIFQSCAKAGQRLQGLLARIHVVNLGYDGLIVFVELLASKFAADFFRNALDVWAEEVELLPGLQDPIKYVI